ncbi:MAG: restriction endonuclease [Nocardioides sp.]|nr:restriction endonuclease [Nocardioides sp.]
MKESPRENLRLLLSEPIDCLADPYPAGASLGAALLRRGVTTPADLLAEVPTSYSIWGGEADLRPAMGAARRSESRQAEQERLATYGDPTPQDVDDTIAQNAFVEGVYTRSPDCDRVNAERQAQQGGEPMEFGNLATQFGDVHLFGVPRQLSGSRVWTLSRVSPDDEMNPMLFNHQVFSTPLSEVIPRWRGMTLAMSIARLLLTAEIFGRLDSLASGDEFQHIHALSLLHTPTSLASTHVDEQSIAQALKWLGSLATEPAISEDAADQLRSGPPVLPAPRMIKGHAAAEEYVADVLAALGFRHVSRTPTGADGGVDVTGDGLVAQVKMEALPTGRDRLQALFGVATVENARAVFFSLSGYTANAVAWADRAGVALLSFGYDGAILAENAEGRRILSQGA